MKKRINNSIVEKLLREGIIKKFQKNEQPRMNEQVLVLQSGQLYLAKHLSNLEFEIFKTRNENTSGKPGHTTTKNVEAFYKLTNPKVVFSRKRIATLATLKPEQNTKRVIVMANISVHSVESYEKAGIVPDVSFWTTGIVVWDAKDPSILTYGEKSIYLREKPEEEGICVMGIILLE